MLALRAFSAGPAWVPVPSGALGAGQRTLLMELPGQQVLLVPSPGLRPLLAHPELCSLPQDPGRLRGSLPAAHGPQESRRKRSESPTLAHRPVPRTCGSAIMAMAPGFL